MCAVSAIFDHYNDKWSKKIQDAMDRPYPAIYPPPYYLTKEEIEDFRSLYEKMKKYDEEHNQPDCELESKKAKLVDLAKELGAEIKFDD